MIEIIKQDKFTTYKNIKVKKGYLGDFTTEWWTDEDWTKHNKKVEEYKADGTYGEESYVNITIMNNPLFDDNNIHKNKPVLESYRMILLNNE